MDSRYMMDGKSVLSAPPLHRSLLFSSCTEDGVSGPECYAPGLNHWPAPSSLPLHFKMGICSQDVLQEAVILGTEFL